MFLAVATSAHAQTLTFEGLKNNEAVSNYYNGGAGGSGSVGGTNFGLAFSPNSLALIDNSLDPTGTGNFRNAPSGKTTLYFLSGSAATMNAAAGFNTGFSFYYADQIGFTGTVNVYSGLNATGSLLATLSLPSTPNPYTVFVPVGVTFAGTAHSVDFGGSVNSIGFDNITINSAIPGVPEPGSIALMIGMGTTGAGFLAHRRRRVHQAA